MLWQLAKFSVTFRESLRLKTWKWRQVADIMFKKAQKPSVCHFFRANYRPISFVCSSGAVHYSTSGLLPGQILRGMNWDYRLADAVKGDKTHSSSIVKAKIEAREKSLDHPDWFYLPNHCLFILKVSFAYVGPLSRESVPRMRLPDWI